VERKQPTSIEKTKTMAEITAKDKQTKGKKTELKTTTSISYLILRKTKVRKQIDIDKGQTSKDKKTKNKNRGRTRTMMKSTPIKTKSGRSHRAPMTVLQPLVSRRLTGNIITIGTFTRRHSYPQAVLTGRQNNLPQA
jgi:hypothetical protein